ncbi:hypothetical protein BCR43DRAFT_493185 [Syncephalastrum racemosum]|uniref:Uncharacterized protein n=1 Tax=Syncephalastrum racemosum TaxID=13706 RepID=A0A1X2HA90_SYNRA|nr:hypothetical protein BCR43DRAFT_493185 [Syncephalastrum racemosum]
MAKVGQALAVSFGALFGGALGFYFLEDYKIKSKVRYFTCSLCLSFFPSFLILSAPCHSLIHSFTHSNFYFLFSIPCSILIH